MKKRIIWSNMNLDIKDWKDGYKEYLEMNDMDGDPNDEHAIYEWMWETNGYYLEDEMANLNKQVEGRIVAIADLGLWNGRVSGYKILGNNIKDIFNVCVDGSCIEFYGDGHNIRAIEHHHDGTNYYLFKVLREDKNVDRLLDSIYNGEEINRSKMKTYTKSLYKEVANVYGWM